MYGYDRSMRRVFPPSRSEIPANILAQYSSPIAEAELEWARQARLAHPEITSYGFSLPKCDPTGSFKRELTLPQLKMVAVCRRWLNFCPPVKRITKTIGTNGYKHNIEEWPLHPLEDTYIMEGALVLAVLHNGTPIQKAPYNSRSAFLGVAAPSVYNLRLWEMV